MVGPEPPEGLGAVLVEALAWGPCAVISRALPANRSLCGVVLRGFVGFFLWKSTLGSFS